MTRMSKSISLVLIGSSLIVGGCVGWSVFNPNPNDENANKDGRAVGTHGGVRRTGGHVFPWFFRTGSSWGGGTSSGGTGASGGRSSSSSSVHSGGFGSTGHAVSGGS